MLTARLKSLLPLPVRKTWWHLHGMAQRPVCNLLRIVAPPDYSRVLALYSRQEVRSQAGLIRLRLRGARRPTLLRRRSSDFDVFEQVFILRHYARLPVRDPRVIIDAGANIGLSTLFFLRAYPRAHVLALEPDPANYALAVRNLRDFAGRCTLLPAALWSASGEVAVHRGAFGDGREWATHVTADLKGAPLRVPAYSIVGLMERFGMPTVDLLKIDIEGAEEVVFGNGDLSFLGHVRCIAIELHGERCRKTFEDATRAHEFEYTQQGDVTIARRPGLSATREPVGF
jgi:FkbM family methyltransferase